MKKLLRGPTVSFAILCMYCGSGRSPRSLNVRGAHVSLRRDREQRAVVSGLAAGRLAFGLLVTLFYNLAAATTL